MRSLRRQLVVTLVAAFAVVWIATAAWFFTDSRERLREVLDTRLSDAAEMLHGLLVADGGGLDPLLSGSRHLRIAESFASVPEHRLGVQIWNRASELVVLAGNAPKEALSRAESGYALLKVGGKLWRSYTLTDYRTGMRLIVAEHLETRRSVMANMALGLAAPFLALVPLSALIIWFGVARGLRRLNRLGADMERLGLDRLTPVDTKDIPEEVAPLMHSINRLLARLARAFERERRFTSDASHELRTPLAALKIQAQVARASGDAVRRRHALEQIVTAANRVQAMLSQLLDLAHMEQDGAAEPIACCDVVSVIRRETGECGKRARERGVSIIIATCNESVWVSATETGLAIALRNLFANAIRHARQGGAVTIRVERCERLVRISVLDDGQGMPVDELEHARERFYRGIGRRGEGSGLGLSIVGALAERYGGTLELANRRDRSGFAATLVLRQGAVPAQRH